MSSTRRSSQRSEPASSSARSGLRTQHHRAGRSGSTACSRPAPQLSRTKQGAARGQHIRRPAPARRSAEKTAQQKRSKKQRPRPASHVRSNAQRVNDRPGVGSSSGKKALRCSRAQNSRRLRKKNRGRFVSPRTPGAPKPSAQRPDLKENRELSFSSRLRLA